ncbi:MAG: hypothetical protein U0794_00915 [Isosphaeraceae bacterium]
MNWTTGRLGGQVEPLDAEYLAWSVRGLLGDPQPQGLLDRLLAAVGRFMQGRFMRLPRLKTTVRRMLCLVAIVAISLAIADGVIVSMRAGRYRRLADWCDRMERRCRQIDAWTAATRAREAEAAHDDPYLDNPARNRQMILYYEGLRRSTGGPPCTRGLHSRSIRPTPDTADTETSFLDHTLSTGDRELQGLALSPFDLNEGRDRATSLHGQ